MSSAIVRVAFAIICMCHIASAALQLFLPGKDEKGQYTLLQESDAFDIMNYGRTRLINMIVSGTKSKQIVFVIPSGHSAMDDEESLASSMFNASENDGVCVFLVYFVKEHGRGFAFTPTKRRIDHVEVLKFYQVLIELKSRLAEEQRDFLVLGTRKMMESGVIPLILLPEPFIQFYNKNVKGTNPFAKPAFNDYYFIEWEGMWRYMSTISTQSRPLQSNMASSQVYSPAMKVEC